MESYLLAYVAAVDRTFHFTKHSVQPRTFRSRRFTYRGNWLRADCDDWLPLSVSDNLESPKQTEHTNIPASVSGAKFDSGYRNIIGNRIYGSNIAPEVLDFNHVHCYNVRCVAISNWTHGFLVRKLLPGYWIHPSYIFFATDRDDTSVFLFSPANKKD